jgi:hypothetical protein
VIRSLLIFDVSTTPSAKACGTATDIVTDAAIAIDAINFFTGISSLETNSPRQKRFRAGEIGDY